MENFLCVMDNCYKHFASFVWGGRGWTLYQCKLIKRAINVRLNYELTLKSFFIVANASVLTVCVYCGLPVGHLT